MRDVGKLITVSSRCRRAQEWDAKKAYILQKFATTGPIKVTASFDILSSNKGKNEKQTAEARIAELEDPMIGGRRDNQTLTMQEYGPSCLHWSSTATRGPVEPRVEGSAARGDRSWGAGV
jgi:hypothetical protein